MKNLLLVTGFILIILNTLIGLLISKYLLFNYLMVDLSLVISTSLTYLFANSNISDGYKIGLTSMLTLTGLIKVVCCIITSPYFQNNVLIVTFLVVTAFEILCLISAFAMKKFA
jgi:FtsH-binding integral membrane protein